MKEVVQSQITARPGKKGSSHESVVVPLQALSRPGYSTKAINLVVTTDFCGFPLFSSDLSAQLSHVQA